VGLDIQFALNAFTLSVVLPAIAMGTVGLYIADVAVGSVLSIV
jgi:hypothetical protein